MPSLLIESTDSMIFLSGLMVKSGSFVLPHYVRKTRVVNAHAHLSQLSMRI